MNFSKLLDPNYSLDLQAILRSSSNLQSFKPIFRALSQSLELQAILRYLHKIIKRINKDGRMHLCKKINDIIFEDWNLQIMLKVFANSFILHLIPTHTYTHTHTHIFFKKKLDPSHKVVKVFFRADESQISFNRHKHIIGSRGYHNRLCHPLPVQFRHSSTIYNSGFTTLSF